MHFRMWPIFLYEKGSCLSFTLYNGVKNFRKLNVWMVYILFSVSFIYKPKDLFASNCLKFIYSEKATKFCKIFTYFWLVLHRTKVKWRFRKISWPRQNIWTLSTKIRNAISWYFAPLYTVLGYFIFVAPCVLQCSLKSTY